MNSIGGEWADGMVIFDAIRMCHSYITIISYGQVESMSSIILQAADYRYITQNAYFMCHYGSSGIAADYLSAQNWINYEKIICNTMLDIYSSQCHKGQFFKEKYAKPDEAKVKNFLSKRLKEGDWYMSAEESVYYGFADKIIKDWKQLS
jgi:ATP-dependent protease ClpP protease subunit